MLKKYAALTSLPIFYLYSPLALADEANFKFSGVVNSNYQYKEYAATEKSKAKFNDLTLYLNYQKYQWSGAVTARCYQFKAYYYVADLGYRIPDQFQTLTGFRPYVVLSGLMKKDNLPNSYRNIAGLAFDYKQLRVNAEYMWAKNDAFIGGDMNAFADSKDTEWKQLFYLNFAFNF